MKKILVLLWIALGATPNLLAQKVSGMPETNYVFSANQHPDYGVAIGLVFENTFSEPLNVWANKGGVKTVNVGDTAQLTVLLDFSVSFTQYVKVYWKQVAFSQAQDSATAVVRMGNHLATIGNSILSDNHISGNFSDTMVYTYEEVAGGYRFGLAQSSSPNDSFYIGLPAMKVGQYAAAETNLPVLVTDEFAVSGSLIARDTTYDNVFHKSAVTQLGSLKTGPSFDFFPHVVVWTGENDITASWAKGEPSTQTHSMIASDFTTLMDSLFAFSSQKHVIVASVQHPATELYKDLFGVGGDTSRTRVWAHLQTILDSLASMKANIDVLTASPYVLGQLNSSDFIHPFGQALDTFAVRLSKMLFVLNFQTEPEIGYYEWQPTAEISGRSGKIVAVASMPLDIFGNTAEPFNGFVIKTTDGFEIPDSVTCAGLTVEVWCKKTPLEVLYVGPFYDDAVSFGYGYFPYMASLSSPNNLLKPKDWTPVQVLPFPINIISFTADQARKRLHFELGGIANGESFELQRSTDGETFYNLEEYFPASESFSGSYTESNQPAGSYQYRLVTKDVQGGVKYSDVVELIFEYHNAEIKVLGNPLSVDAQSISLSEKVSGRVRLFNFQGVLIYSWSVTEEDFFTIPQGIAAGAYCLAGEDFSVKVIFR